MTGEIIKSFLVGLGFDVDDTSLAKFNKAINSASIRVAALYASIQTASAGIFYGISKMSQGFEDIGYQLRLVAPAINKMLILREAMLSAYRAAGINLTKVVQQSILFNYSLAKTKFALEAVYKSVGAKFLPLLTKQMDIFRAKIFANMPKIQEHLEKLVHFIFKAFDATVQLGSRVWEVLGRVWDFFKRLDEVTGGWSTKILLAVAAWKYLNLAFLTTPFGAVIAGIVALIGLYDDFMVWKEGGESLIDWGSRTTQIVVGIIAVVAELAAGIGVVAAAIKVWTIAQIGLDVAMAANPLGAMIIGVTALIGLLGLLAAKFGYLKGIGDFFASAGSQALSLFGAPNSGGALQSALAPAPIVQQAGNSNQRVQQETNIVIQGSADASAVGKQVAGQQEKVNFDMTRNLKGAMR